LRDAAAAAGTAVRSGNDDLCRECATFLQAQRAMALKFRRGERVRLTPTGERTLLARAGSRRIMKAKTGMVVNGTRGPRVKVLVDGNAWPGVYSVEFWEKDVA
jgi:hypothetical protein